MEMEKPIGKKSAFHQKKTASDLKKILSDSRARGKMLL